MIKELIIYVVLTGIGFFCGMIFGSMAKEQEQRQANRMPPGEEDMMGYGEFSVKELEEQFEPEDVGFDSNDFSLFE